MSAFVGLTTDYQREWLESLIDTLANGKPWRTFAQCTGGAEALHQDKVKRVVTIYRLGKALQMYFKATANASAPSGLPCLKDRCLPLMDGIIIKAHKDGFEVAVSLLFCPGTPSAAMKKARPHCRFFTGEAKSIGPERTPGYVLFATAIRADESHPWLCTWSTLPGYAGQDLRNLAGHEGNALNLEKFNPTDVFGFSHADFCEKLRAYAPDYSFLMDDLDLRYQKQVQYFEDHPEELSRFSRAFQKSFRAGKRQTAQFPRANAQTVGEDETSDAASSYASPPARGTAHHNAGRGSASKGSSKKRAASSQESATSAFASSSRRRQRIDDSSTVAEPSRPIMLHQTSRPIMLHQTVSVTDAEISAFLLESENRADDEEFFCSESANVPLGTVSEAINRVSDGIDVDDANLDDMFSDRNDQASDMNVTAPPLEGFQAISSYVPDYFQPLQGPLHVLQTNSRVQQDYGSAPTFGNFNHQPVFRRAHSLDLPWDPEEIVSEDSEQ